MTMEATGVAFMVITTGSIMSRKNVNLALNTPLMNETAMAMIRPRKMRSIEKSTESQNSAVPESSMRRVATSTGLTRRTLESRYKARASQSRR